MVSGSRQRRYVLKMVESMASAAAARLKIVAIVMVNGVGAKTVRGTKKRAA
jgi:hypothetical protein